MSDRKHFAQKEKELELIEAFETFSLYYDRKDKSLWVWDGENFVGISAELLCKDLLTHIPWAVYTDELDYVPKERVNT